MCNEYQGYATALGGKLHEYSITNHATNINPFLEEYKNDLLKQYQDVLSQELTFTNPQGVTTTYYAQSSQEDFDKIEEAVNQEIDEVSRSDDINRQRLSLLADTFGIDVIFNFEKNVAEGNKPTVFIKNTNNVHYEAYTKKIPASYNEDT